MKLLKKIFLIFFLKIFSLAQLISYQYPVKNIRITSLFGESRRDHFHTGMDFSIPQPIYPIANGETLFQYDYHSHPNNHYYGIGNAVIIEHYDQIRSHYYHLKDGSIPENLISVSPQDQIGFMGATGNSYGSHLHLTIVDFAEKEFINPSRILPKVNDERKPQIVTFLGIINKKIYKFGTKATMKYFGPIQLFVIAADLRYDYPKKKSFSSTFWIGLKSLKIKVDDKILRYYDFRSIMPDKKDELITYKGVKFTETYGLDFNYRVGTFTPSSPKHVFEITAEDWNGNISTKKYTIYFR